MACRVSTASGLVLAIADRRAVAREIVMKRQLAILAVVFLSGVAGTFAATDQDDLQTGLRIADRLYNDHRWEEAIAAYRMVLKNAPTVTVSLVQIARSYRNLGETDRAIAAYKELLRVDENNDEGRMGLAFCYLEKGDLAAAEPALNRAAEGHPTREVLYNLGELSRVKGRTSDAIKWYRLAKQLDPSWDRPTERLALVDRPATVATTPASR